MIECVMDPEQRVDVGCNGSRHPIVKAGYCACEYAKTPAGQKEAAAAQRREDAVVAVERIIEDLTREYVHKWYTGLTGRVVNESADGWIVYPAGEFSHNGNGGCPDVEAAIKRYDSKMSVRVTAYRLSDGKASNVKSPTEVAERLLTLGYDVGLRVTQRAPAFGRRNAGGPVPTPATHGGAIMARIAIANILRDCQCGMPATVGRYCNDCDSNVRTMIDDNNRVSGRLYDEPTEGMVHGA